MSQDLISQILETSLDGEVEVLRKIDEVIDLSFFTELVQEHNARENPSSGDAFSRYNHVFRLFTLLSRNFLCFLLILREMGSATMSEVGRRHVSVSSVNNYNVRQLLSFDPPLVVRGDDGRYSLTDFGEKLVGMVEELAG